MFNTITLRKPFRLSILVFTFLFISLTLSEAFASPGRLNKDGCHASKADGYHCHEKVDGKTVITKGKKKK